MGYSLSEDLTSRNRGPGDSVVHRKRVARRSRVQGLGQRSYNPGLGRWVSRDPAGEYWDFGLYGFVWNNPIRFVDTDGRGGFPLPPDPKHPGHGRGPADGNAPPARGVHPPEAGCTSDADVNKKEKVGDPYQKDCGDKCGAKVNCQDYRTCMKFTLIGSDGKVVSEWYSWIPSTECDDCPNPKK